YNLLFLILTYILPLMTMGIAYTLMARVLWGSKQIGESTQAQMNLICSKQKVVRMLICGKWPWLVNSKATQHIYLAIYWLAMSNSMLNPIILLLMNRRFRRYSTKFLNCWPFTQIFPCISAAQQSLPSEACNTAIVTHGPNHQETQTVLLCNGLQDGSGAGVAGEGEEEDMPEAEGKTMYDNGGDSSNGEQKHLNHSNSHNNSHNHQHYQNHHHHHHHHHRNGYSLRKDSSQKSTRPLVASMSIRYSP
ncbi:PREDICTED: tachykinin-like peptides receptor 99D, partial [Rhagoletis zephyria]|uniref:tachykinin-like peptides receptor 99D n=1 Tax=Rhagoletis zephyria TaxID=28612 RepID=UPI0008115747